MFDETVEFVDGRIVLWGDVEFTHDEFEEYENWLEEKSAQFFGEEMA